MADLTTKYLGLTLRNPIIAGSSGLTNSLREITELEKSGVSAVVLKSLFEEEILAEIHNTMKSMTQTGNVYPEIYDFFGFDDIEDSLSKYLFLIEDLKKTIKIPIIASVNCVSSNEWTIYAKKFEEAGADALELNMFIMPSDLNRSAEENEKIYFEVAEKVKKEINIPVALKISSYFSNLGQMIQKLSETGIDGLVLFNRFWSPDFDIDNFTVIPANVYSSPSDLAISLRWIAIMSERVKCDLAASTGIHDGTAVIKQILAGANAVQVASTLYRNGLSSIPVMLTEIENWMNKKGLSTLSEFRGRMSQAKSLNPAAYERAQFMKHFSGKTVLV